MSWSQVAPNSGLHPNLPAQSPNSVWTFGTGRDAAGTLPPFLIKGRYGEPILTRIYNNTPINRDDNEGFGRNETQFHFHNAHKAPKAMAQPTRITFLVPSTTIAGAPR